MGAATKLAIQNIILSKARALGNTKKGFKEVCSDLINDYCNGDKKKMKHLADGTFLCVSTLERMSTLDETKDGAPYRPQVETCERILKFFNAEVSFSQTALKAQYMNKPKL